MLLTFERVPDNLLSNLENRDIALWVFGLPKDSLAQGSQAAFLGLPWRLVLSEIVDPKLLSELEKGPSADDPMTRKRGFIQVVDSDPSRIELPEKCLPIYLLNGRGGSTYSSDFANRLRRMTMLEELRRSNIREILVISTNGDPVPPELKDLWSSGFRSHLTFVSDAPEAGKALESWLETSKGSASASLLTPSVDEVILDITRRYLAAYPEDRQILRIRDVQGRLHKIDVTELDEPERPLLASYSVLEERDLNPLVPEELSEEDFISFFRNATSSWRPYAAGLPWTRDAESRKIMLGLLKKLDSDGAESNCIAYISSEAGAGGTTLARSLAWECAREGYPVLIAKQLPFSPDVLPVSNYLSRIHHAIESSGHRDGNGTPRTRDKELGSRLYETPWVIVFDRIHWEDRDAELIHFRNEMEKAGRPVCLLVVTGPMLGLSFWTRSIFKRVSDLNHSIEQEDAQALGTHLNRFLRLYGKDRKQWQWEAFYKSHTVRYIEGTAAFWVTLSFWIQGQYDLSESIQEWIYRTFKQNATDRTIQESVLRIAALSSERLPLPEVLLPSPSGKWPTSQLLADARPNLASLGLVRVTSNQEKYWALVHDILGRFLINALFYDFALREELGFSAAKNAEHLRYLLLRQISQHPALGERAYSAIGEDFATSIFKIDPDHGHGGFASMWREVLDALDKMPRPLRDTSRLFRHHTAISRRRIAKFDEHAYGISNEDRIRLLNGAIADINYALTYIDYTPGSESNLNLFNSLANAYFDLADAEAKIGASRERIAELRTLANDATRRAYAENPTNSFVIETYVRNLLQAARDYTEHAVEQCIEALGILFSALTTNEAGYRAAQLGDLSSKALSILFQQTPPSAEMSEPRNPIDVLVHAWRTLSAGVHVQSMTLSEVPEENLVRALEALRNPIGRGNMQVIRLTYDLECISRPYSFKEQLDLVEQLQATDFRMTAQMRLEYAILLFQSGRAGEGDKIFRLLRQLWRDSELYVQIPERLRWLRNTETGNLQTVHAIIASDYGNRGFARVRDFGSIQVPFRPEEHSLRNVKPGTVFVSRVTFGHNGPFLRPVTASPDNVRSTRG